MSEHDPQAETAADARLRYAMETRPKIARAVRRALIKAAAGDPMAAAEASEALRMAEEAA